MTVSQDMVVAMQGHSTWANQRLLDAAESLTADQLREPVPGANGSLLEVLVHMMAAQIGWTRRFQELEPIAPPDVDTFTSIDALRAAWTAVDNETAAYLGSLTEVDLAAVIHFKSWFGWEGESPRWQAILHQAYHQHQHRGEVAMILTALGYSPGELDMFDFLDPDD